MANQNIKLVDHIDKAKNEHYDYSFLGYDYNSFDLVNFKNRDKHWYQRAKDLLPRLTNFKSLGEGGTPLLQSKAYKNCFIKDEARNPSGCFKDRESAMVFPFYIEKGFKEFGIVSSGNAALSAALYGSIYGVKVKCFVPKGTSEPKKNLIKLFGGSLEAKGKDYEDCYHKFFKDSSKKKICNITPGVCSLRDQGDKLIAFEIFEEIGVPDYVFVPSANGSLLFGIFNGFKELMLLGLSKKMPKMVAVQIKGAAPLAEALKQKKDYVILDELVDTKAEGLVAMESYCSPKATYALRATGGFVAQVSDSMLNSAMKYALSKEGIVPEWTSSTGFAALQNTYKTKKITENDMVVLINTGSGMKEIDSILDSLTRRKG